MPEASRIIAALGHLSRAPELIRSTMTIADWWRVSAAYVGLSSLQLPVDVHCRDGSTFRLQEFYDLETLWQIYVREVYRVTPEHRTILDAGANIGLFACYAAKRSPGCVVHAVEPFPATVRRLRETVERNGLQGRVAIHETALSSTSGGATMSAAVAASQMVHLVAGRADGTGNAGVPVRTTTLTELMNDIGADRIDLLKMDIEGSEYDVLGSTGTSTLARIGAITLEYHKPDASTPSAKQDLARHLVQNGGFHMREDPTHPDEYGILHFTR
jgi:FkbM family methyltransferase